MALVVDKKKKTRKGLEGRGIEVQIVKKKEIRTKSRGLTKKGDRKTKRMGAFRTSKIKTG